MSLGLNTLKGGESSGVEVSSFIGQMKKSEEAKKNSMSLGSSLLKNTSIGLKSNPLSGISKGLGAAASIQSSVHSLMNSPKIGGSVSSSLGCLAQNPPSLDDLKAGAMGLAAGAMGAAAGIASEVTGLADTAADMASGIQAIASAGGGAIGGMVQGAAFAALNTFKILKSQAQAEIAQISGLANIGLNVGDVGNFMDSMGATLASSGTSLLLNNISKLGHQFAGCPSSGTNGLLSGIGGDISKIGSGISNGINSLESGISNIENGVTSGINNLKNGISNGINSLENGISNGINGIESEISGGIGKLGSSISSGIGRIGGDIGEITGSVTNALTQSAIGQSIKNMDCSGGNGFNALMNMGMGGCGGHSGGMSSTAKVMKIAGDAVNVTSDSLSFVAGNKKMKGLVNKTFKPEKAIKKVLNNDKGKTKHDTGGDIVKVFGSSSIKNLKKEIKKKKRTSKTDRRRREKAYIGGIVEAAKVAL